MCGVAIASAQPETIRVGAIDFFGTGGMNAGGIRAALPIRSGDTISEADFDAMKARIETIVAAQAGAPSTGISGVCCDADHRLLIYIGLPGSNSHAIPYGAPPSGGACLSPSARALYATAADAMEAAIKAGETGEDHSKGYALSTNPDYRARQMDMREYALKNAAQLEKVLGTCEHAADREAAAELLGYADQSRSSVEALVRAAGDPSEAVRNNAVRALWALASSRLAAARRIQPRPFVAMLNSASWNDRNKAGLLLAALTESRNPGVLAELRRDALDSLVEMARWQDRLHADPYRLILGRVAGMDESRIHELIAGGRVEEIIAAVNR